MMQLMTATLKTPKPLPSIKSTQTSPSNLFILGTDEAKKQHKLGTGG